MIRGFLDRLLLGSGDSGRAPLGRARAALDFLEATDGISASHHFAEGYSFNREELYEDRGAVARARRTG